MRPLLLAGGKSTRMGSPKHLLSLPDGQPLYLRLAKTLHAACPGSVPVVVSLAHDSILDQTLRNATEQGGCMLAPEGWQPSDGLSTPNKQHLPILKVLIDEGEGTRLESAGPAAGLLAAHRAYPSATWLVLACDFPFCTTEILHQLQSEYQSPVTCFRNDEGFIEPLLAIWSPDALRRLEDNTANGNSSPSAVVRQLGGLVLAPPRQTECKKDEDPEFNDGLERLSPLFNVNTKEEWGAVLRVKRCNDGILSTA
ncbi:uncharacterized protein PpBr36_06399 [Pyricularia pennisetigena]|uniref:uncharacterized protein n=1 Tax=Pyricularia pennisetigena TaxID=1578925 RepID=UPI0011545A88|nr:uncharacterized protein PpBr36_06399 [Pyricularia pennisetigena]TLS23622.1 hypothetical protein PpBr36_06399 [Pyricularia pennisetigena]